MESFIIRIYRQEDGVREKLLGIVEWPGEGRKFAFTEREELWRILVPGEQQGGPAAGASKSK